MSMRIFLPGDRGRWVRRGGSIVLHGADGDGEVQGEVATPVPVTATQAGVIDGRIDVHAQYALLRMAKSPNHGARTDASQMLGAVKSGALAGIYKEDQQVPALRARRMGSNWWQAIRPGEDADLLFHAVEAPLINFRTRVAKNPVALDAALRGAWARFAEMALPLPTEIPIRCERRPRRPVGVVLAASTCDPRDGLLVPTCADIPTTCTGTRVEKAVCEFKKRVANPRLVCHGQFYWTRLACAALQQLQTPVRPPFTPVFPDGETLFQLLTDEYVRNGGPRTPDALEQWFVKQFKRSVDQKDVDALDSVDADKCHDTVTTMVRLLRLSPSGPQCLGSLSPKQLV